MRESKFQSDFISTLRDMGCICLKQDPTVGRQKGVPDYLVIYKSRWMFLEFKASLSSPYRPLQKEWGERLSKWGYWRRVCPENSATIMREIKKMMRGEDMIQDARKIS